MYLGSPLFFILYSLGKIQKQRDSWCWFFMVAGFFYFFKLLTKLSTICEQDPYREGKNKRLNQLRKILEKWLYLFCIVFVVAYYIVCFQILNKIVKCHNISVADSVSSIKDIYLGHQSCHIRHLQLFINFLSMHMSFVSKTH